MQRTSPKGASLGSIPICHKTLTAFSNSSYIFVEFSTVDEANLAIANVHGTHFDKSHALFANRFTDIEKFANMDETYMEPVIEEYTPQGKLMLVDYTFSCQCLLCLRSTSELG